VFDFNDLEPGFDESAYWIEPDFMLSDLVSVMVNKAGMELGITLIIKGSVLTGTLISERAYLKIMTDTFITQATKSMPAPTQEDLDAIQEMFDFTGFTEDFYPGEDYDPEDTEGLDLPHIRHLHLKEATIVSPEPSITFTHGDTSVMRVRLIAVDSWTLGRTMLMSGEEVEDTDDTMPPVLH
jgi:hypothetical protein